MADSMFTTLLSMLDKRSLGGIATALGENDQTVSRGMQSAIAAVLGGLASKSDDTGMLRKMLDMVPADSGDVAWSNVAGSVSDPNSPIMSAGKRMLSTLFGGSEGAVLDTLSRETGLRSGIMSTLLSIAGPVVMSFLTRRMRDEGMTVSGLGAVLQRESGAIRAALPAGLTEMFWPRAAATTASPVVAQAVERERSTPGWIAPLAIAACALGLLWLFGHARRPVQPITSGSANRVAPGYANLGEFVRVKLPNNTVVSIPERGVETRLLAFIQNPNASPDQTTWFNFDRLLFDTGAATLRPESQEQLNNVAAILVAYPNVRLKIGGYTDNVGAPDQNLQLSRDRANAVMAEEIRRGIAPDRLSAAGYGEQFPVADNSTEEGRAQNRRVAMRVTQK
jgi:outer membrane protein OmpA-like peptidoglycan-associated protein